MPKQITSTIKYPNKIFLIGFMGVGKTTFGKKIAKHIGYKFIDTDKFIVEKANSSIPEIFENKGELFFRKLEEEALNKLLQEDNVVIATGGGMGSNKTLLDKMLKNGTVCYLKLDEKSIVNRLVSSTSSRPLIDGLSFEEVEKKVEQLLSKRKPIYEQANIIFPAINLKGVSKNRIEELFANKL